MRQLVEHDEQHREVEAHERGDGAWPGQLLAQELSHPEATITATSMPLKKQDRFQRMLELRAAASRRREREWKRPDDAGG